MHTAVVGLQWGDEGKGKIVDALTPEAKYIVRSQGGNNAGHTVVVGNEKFKFHLLPTGMIHPDKVCVMGNGMVVNLEVLLDEVSSLRKRVSRHAELYISDRANIIMPWHVELDKLTGKKIGTTGRGIGPCYADKVARKGIRFADLLDAEVFVKKVTEELEEKNWLLVNKYGSNRLNGQEIVNHYLNLVENFKGFVAKTENILNGAVQSGESILFEGAQASLLDVDFGTYPFVTSSNTTIGGIITGSGVFVKDLNIIGVAKAYDTRVGEGPFPTELKNKVGEYLRQKGHEFGTTTGRPRRCGWFDVPSVIYSSSINAVDSVAITKLDVLSGLENILICTAYKVNGKRTLTFPTELSQAEPIYERLPGWKEKIDNSKSFSELPSNAQTYIRAIEGLIGKHVGYIGVGERRDQLIRR
jgi:adenylosuccinate synthase